MDKIVCVGKNYLDHAKELGDAVPEKPVLFLKPPSVLRAATRPSEKLALRLPADAGSVHHECELVVRLVRGGFRLSVAEAEKAIGWLTVGLDMTLRDRQALAKKNGHPWETSKVFPDSAVVGPWVEAGKFPRWLETSFTLSIDGEVRQEGKGVQMSMRPAECIAYASEFFPLLEGDLLFTGTPAGVGPVAAGQTGELRWGDIAYAVTWNA